MSLRGSAVSQEQEGLHNPPIHLCFLDFFTARSLFSLEAMLTPLLLLELWLDSEPFSFGDFSSVQFSHSLMSDSL